MYRLWVGAVADAPSLASGSVIADIEVPDFSRPRLALGGISFSIRGQVIASRHFSAAEDVMLCADVYDRRRSSGPWRGRSGSDRPPERSTSSAIYSGGCAIPTLRTYSADATGGGVLCRERRRYLDNPFICFGVPVGCLQRSIVACGLHGQPYD